MIVDLGLGMGLLQKDATEREGEKEEGTGEEQEDEEGVGSDTQVLHAVVEELNERFTDEEVEEMLATIRKIIWNAKEN